MCSKFGKLDVCQFVLHSDLLNLMFSQYNMYVYSECFIRIYLAPCNVFHLFSFLLECINPQDDNIMVAYLTQA